MSHLPADSQPTVHFCACRHSCTKANRRQASFFSDSACDSMSVCKNKKEIYQYWILFSILPIFCSTRDLYIQLYTHTVLTSSLDLQQWVSKMKTFWNRIIMPSRLSFLPGLCTHKATTQSTATQSGECEYECEWQLIAELELPWVP